MKCWANSVTPTRRSLRYTQLRSYRTASIRGKGSPCIIFTVLDLHTEVKYVKGVGPRVAEWLAQKNIFTVEDLLYYLPFRYEDRLNPPGIAELRPGEMATGIAEGRNSAALPTKRLPTLPRGAGQR